MVIWVKVSKLNVFLDRGRSYADLRWNINITTWYIYRLQFHSNTNVQISQTINWHISSQVTEEYRYIASLEYDPLIWRDVKTNKVVTHIYINT